MLNSIQIFLEHQRFNFYWFEFQERIIFTRICLIIMAVRKIGTGLGKATVCYSPDATSHAFLTVGKGAKPGGTMIN